MPPCLCLPAAARSSSFSGSKPTCCLDTLSCNFVKIFPIDFVGLSPSLFPLACCLPVGLLALFLRLPSEQFPLPLFHSARSYGNEMCFYFSFTSLIFFSSCVCAFTRSSVCLGTPRNGPRKYRRKKSWGCLSSLFTNHGKLQFSMPPKMGKHKYERGKHSGHGLVDQMANICTNFRVPATRLDSFLQGQSA